MGARGIGAKPKRFKVVGGGGPDLFNPEGTAPARVRGDRRPAETSEAPGRTAHAKPAGKRPPSGDRPTGGPKGGPAGKPRGRDADRRR